LFRLLAHQWVQRSTGDLLRPLLWVRCSTKGSFAAFSWASRSTAHHLASASPIAPACLLSSYSFFSNGRRCPHIYRSFSSFPLYMGPNLRCARCERVPGPTGVLCRSHASRSKKTFRR